MSEVEPSAKGPQRRVCKRTGEGAEELREWLSGKPILADVRIHYLAQLFFLGELGDLEKTHAFFLDLRRSFTQQLEAYAAIEQQLGIEFPGYPDAVSSDIFHPALALQYGIHRIRANLSWCEEAIQQVESRLVSDNSSPSDPGRPQNQ